MSCLDDATVLGLVEGRLAPELIARVDEHIDSCASCRDVVTLVASSQAPSRVLGRGDTVDRYVIGDLLGAGAMGRVYSAWEPELDRRVAIKVLHEEGNRDRLIKEAQAMARLNHPNVVTVHEVGTAEAGVFVAMELVEGDTLRTWAAQPRQWREVVRKLVGVARGLAAAHAAGVIHRDVKPENVIVGADDRTRLGDFGLARSGAAAVAAPGPGSFALGTLSGGTAVAGTPAYMAPEVLRGGAATPASDQFSFGVMAYELLAGKRPFEGATWAQLLESIEKHDVRRMADVPGWLDELVRRCLAVDPAARFESMTVVADTLHHKNNQRRPMKWGGVALAAALLASAATWMVASSLRNQRETYDDPEAPLHWGIRGPSPEQGISPTTIATIERWTQSWLDERTALGSSAKHESSERVAARERCLQQRREELRALLQASSKSRERLLDAVSALPAPTECRKADADPLPADPTRAAAASQVLDELPSLRASIALGSPPDDIRTLVDNAAKLVARARASEHAPTLAEALLAHADALRLADRSAEAALVARDAVAAAERGHADLLRARAWLARVAIAGEQRDLAAADDLGAIAHATIDRVGAPHLAASLARLRGLIAYNRGRLAEARTLLLDARSRFASIAVEGTRPRGHADVAGERTLDIAAVDSALGSVARAAGDLDEAEKRHRSVLALDRELRGPNHRDIARDLHNIAGVLRLRGNLDEALATYREALAVEIATQGEKSIAAALTHNSIGLVLLARANAVGARHAERPDLPTKADHQRYHLELGAAKQEFELARDIFATAKHGDLAFAEHNLGLAAQARVDHKTALAHFTAAASIYASTIGTDAVAPLRLDLDRARSEHALGDRAAARKHATLARDRAQTAELAWLVDDATAFLASIPAPVARPSGVEPTPVTVAPPIPAPVKQQPKPQPKKDVGVYGSAQSW